MPVSEQLRSALEFTSVVIESFALGLLVFAFIRAAVHYRRARISDGRGSAFLVFRISLGEGMLLALQVMVISDIISTIITDPSFYNLIGLAGLVGLSTLISWTTSVDVDGRWPWQLPKEPEQPDGRNHD